MKSQSSSDRKNQLHAPTYSHLQQETPTCDKALTALNAVAATVSMTSDIDEVLQRTLTLALQVVDVEAGAISVLDEATNELVFRVQRGWRVHDFAAQKVRVPADQGLSGQVMTTGQPVVTQNINQDLHLAVPEFHDERIQAMVLAPMRARGRVLGMLGVMSYTPCEFSSEEVTVVAAIADQIGIAFDNARLLRESRRRVEELSALQATSIEVASTLDLWTALEIIVSSTLKLTNAAVVELHLYDGESDQLSFATAVRKDGEASLLTHQAPSDGPIAQAARDGEIITLTNLAAAKLSVSAWRTRGIEALVALPLERAVCVLGVLAVAYDTSRSFSDHELRILSLLANQAAIAVERTRLFANETQRSTQLALINRVARQSTATLNLKEVLDTAAAIIQDSSSYFNVALFLIDRATRETVLRAIAGGHAVNIKRGYRQAIGEGVVGWVADKGKTLLINDVAQDPRYRPLSRTTKPVSSELAVPLTRSDQTIGVLDIQHLERKAFAPEDIQAMETLADQLAIAVDNARLYQETQSRVAELAAVQETSLRVVSSLNTGSVLNTVARNALELVNADGLHILLHDTEEDRLAFGTTLWRDEAPSTSPPQQLENFIRDVLNSGSSSVINHAREHPHFASPEAQEIGLEAIAGFPLQSAAGVVGVMAVIYLRPHTFSENELRVLGLLASQAAVAISNARLYEETEQRLAEVSVLYQLARQMNSSLNVQEMLDSISLSLKQAIEGCRGCSIALLDPISSVLEIRAAAGIEDKWKHEFKLQLGEGVAGQVALEGQPAYVSDTLAKKDFIFFNSSVRSLMTVPLSVKDRVIGTLSVDSDQPNAFSTADERLITIAAAQAAIAIENARLYARLKQRAKNLTEAYAELQKADQLKDEMVQNISHELRTPLTFVKGYVELLLTEDVGSLTTEQKEYLEIVVDKTDVVTRLVSDIMFLQQADQISDKKAPISLDNLARRALRGCVVAANKNGLTLAENIPADLPQATGDRGRLMQVFDNLLSNAIKFSPEGGQIMVAIKEVDTMLQVSISDQGIGIPKSQHERIFERFYQVDGSTERCFGGAGLGLAIVKRIIESHGGRIWVESEPAKGSIFHFTIPKYQRS